MSALGLPARPPIRCTAPAGSFNPCGAFDAEHHAAAAKAGVCCQVLADRRGDAAPKPSAGLRQVSDWPPFDPRDDDAPAGGS